MQHPCRIWDLGHFGSERFSPRKVIAVICDIAEMAGMLFGCFLPLVQAPQRGPMMAFSAGNMKCGFGDTKGGLGHGKTL